MNDDNHKKTTLTFEVLTRREKTGDGWFVYLTPVRPVGVITRYGPMPDEETAERVESELISGWTRQINSAVRSIMRQGVMMQ